MGGKEYNFLWLDNKLQQLLEPSHGGAVGPFSIACPSVHEPLALCLYYQSIFAFLPPLRGADEIFHDSPPTMI